MLNAGGVPVLSKESSLVILEESVLNAVRYLRCRRNTIQYIEVSLCAVLRPSFAHYHRSFQDDNNKDIYILGR